MPTLTLAATPRDLTKKPRDLRATRRIPAEFYGSGAKNQHLTLDYQTFRKLFREAGSSTLVDLQIEGSDAAVKVLIHRVDYDPLTDEFQHIDFLQVDMTKKITTHIVLHFTGVSPAVKNLGGILTHNKTELPIRCLPGDLVHEIEVDISKLAEIHDSIRVKDLLLDREKIEILVEEGLPVATVMAPKTAEEIEEEDKSEDVGDAVSAEVKEEAEEEKTAAQLHKEGDSEKKGQDKADEAKEGNKK